MLKVTETARTPEKAPEHGDASLQAAESQRRLDVVQALLDNLPAMAAFWDRDLRNVVANAAYVEWFGVNPDEMLGMHISQVLGPELYEMNLPFMRRALDGEEQLFDRTIRDARGVTRYTQASYVPHRRDDGGVDGFFVLVTDITERKVAEVALANQTRRVETVLDTIADAVLALSPDLKVTYLNRAAAEMVGLEREASIGGDVDDIVHMFDGTARLTIGDHAAEVVTSGVTVERTGSDVVHGRDGKVSGVDWLLTALTATSGDVTGLVLTLRDVTVTRRLLHDAEQRATHDALTGLYNRRFLDRLLSPEQEDSRRATFVLAIDLDGFKSVNDTAGHETGDQVLRQVANELCSAVRETDEIVRMGGDEFAILLRDCDSSAAVSVANSVLDRIAQIDLGWTGHTFEIGASVGLAPVLDHDVERALAMADARCYQAKQSGGHRVVS